MINMMSKLEENGSENQVGNTEVKVIAEIGVTFGYTYFYLNLLQNVQVGTYVRFCTNLLQKCPYEVL